MEGGGGTSESTSDFSGGFGTAGDGTDTGAEPGYGGDFSGNTGLGYADLSDPEAIMDPGLFSSILDSGLAGLNYVDLSDPEAILDAGMFNQSLEGMFSQNPFDNLPKSLKGLAILAAKLGDKTGLASKGLGIWGLATSPNPGQAMAKGGLSTMASMLGPGAAAAMAIANMTGLTDNITAQFGNTVGLQGGQPADSGVGGMLEGLGGIYAGYKGMKDSGDMLGSLQSLYSQDSPYAQALRQQLQRQDAAGGRRSQYGPREVELQARLAQMASSQIPAMSQLSRQQQIARNSMLQQGIGAFRDIGGLEGLKSLFGMGGAGGLYDNAASGLINSGSLGSLFSMDPLDMPYNGPGFDFDDPFGGP